MNAFDEAALRLKQQLKVTEDKQLAEALGMTGKAWTARKRRESFPEEKLWALAAQRPDIDVGYVLTGIKKGEPARALPFGGQIDPYPQPWIPTIDSADEVGKRLAYALNTLTADMAHGFTLVTGYGAIQVAAADAEGFQRLARQMLTHALADHLAARKGQGNGA